MNAQSNHFLRLRLYYYYLTRYMFIASGVPQPEIQESKILSQQLPVLFVVTYV